ncbi:helix-turn-helix domain-containing protein [Chamaesiphon sp. VAR_48_metabat_403]|uniref:helix-turn-helix domain-containing protein n=1 Tax=Chamaesiphon sp. VAR_48_metabat_403 TaxID=2964700 RepID=UPI0037BF8307
MSKKLDMKRENTLKELLRERNISQQELADRMGVKQPMISQWCRTNSDPRASTLIRLARELDVSLKVLMSYLGEDTTGIPDDMGGDEN